MSDYTTSATATGGRDGKVRLDGDGLWVALQVQKELGGGGEGANPEQLFAMGYAACFSSALIFVARSQNVDASKAKVTTKVGITRSDTGFGLDAALTVHIPGMDVAAAQKLADAAHQVCPYSKATRGNMPVTVTAV